MLKYTRYSNIERTLRCRYNEYKIVKLSSKYENILSDFLIHKIYFNMDQININF